MHTLELPELQVLEAISYSQYALFFFQSYSKSKFLVHQTDN